MVGVLFLFFCLISLCYHILIWIECKKLKRHIEDEIFKAMKVDRNKVTRTWKFKI